MIAPSASSLHPLDPSARPTIAAAHAQSVAHALDEWLAERERLRLPIPLHFRRCADTAHRLAASLWTLAYVANEEVRS
jgi:hypothetical protein